MPGTLFVVATPIGNLEDISARALRVLREVTLIAAEDTRRTRNLLSSFGITTSTTSLHQHNEHAKSAFLLERLRGGESLALVSDAGTPTVADPGAQLIRDAIEVGIKVEPIPGPNAAITALSVSGLPHDSFTFLGFPPAKGAERQRWFERLLAAGHTVVFYEAPHRIGRTLAQLKELFGDVNIMVGRELTKAHEELVRGQISEVLSAISDSRGEFTVVVDVGRLTETRSVERPPAELLASEFCVLTKSNGASRRKAAAKLASRYAMSVNEVYNILKDVK